MVVISIGLVEVARLQTPLFTFFGLLYRNQILSRNLKRNWLPHFLIEVPYQIIE